MAILTIRDKKIEYDPERTYLIFDVESRSGGDEFPLIEDPKRLEKIVKDKDRFFRKERPKAFEEFIDGDLNVIYGILYRGEFMVPLTGTVSWGEELRELMKNRKVRRNGRHSRLYLELNDSDKKALKNTVLLYGQILAELGYSSQNQGLKQRLVESGKI